MATRFPIFPTALLALLLSGAGCTRHSSAFPLNVAALRQLGPGNTARISHEESGDDIFVTVVDRHGDGHVHKLNLDGASRTEALDLLRQKEIELGKYP